MSSEEQTAAAWASVHEARRAVRIAWIAALMNGLVIAIALFAPFLQRWVEERSRQDDHDQLKREVILY